MKLVVLCPQLYDGMDMRVTPCNRCTVGWDKARNKCTVETGAEHLDNDPSIPDCPIQNRCQHQMQSDKPCIIRQKGLICESALIEGGMSPADAAEHPLSFHAGMI